LLIGLEEDKMNYRQKACIFGITVLLVGSASYGKDISKDQVKGLDEQVQEIKGDALSISAELAKLEEKLLYPSNTEVSVFVSLKTGETFRLDSVDIQMDGKRVTHHVYTLKELEALRKGGVQKIYTGNVRTGDHDLEVRVSGKTSSGSDFQRSERFMVSKDVAPKIVEVSLAPESIAFKDR
jgi:hypothetical protein